MSNYKKITGFLQQLYNYSLRYFIRSQRIKKMDTYQDDNINLLRFTQGTDQYFTQQDSGFKAWDADNILTENSHMNLLRNFKSQLLTYEQKFKKLQNTKTLPIKLPVLSYMKLKKRTNKSKQKNNITKDQQLILTERKSLNVSQTFNFVKKHKSIDLNKKSIEYRPSKHNMSSNKLQPRQRNHTIDHLEQKNQPIVIPKVQQMKFLQNQKRIRKRDLYLALFGDKGKGKVQKIEFDDQNKAYQTYLQRKNQQTKKNAPLNTKNTQKQDKVKLRCSSQLNSRQLLKKQQPTAIQITQSVNFIIKNNSHQPIRY